MEEAANYAREHTPELSPNERSTNDSTTQPIVKPVTMTSAIKMIDGRQENNTDQRA